MSRPLGERGCGRSSVSNRLVAELAGEDLPYGGLFESLEKDRKRKTTALILLGASTSPRPGPVSSKDSL